MDALLWIAISLILYGIYKYVTLNNDYFQKRGIVHMKPSFLFGNMGKFLFRRATPYEFANEIYTTFPRQKLVKSSRTEIPANFANFIFNVTE